ncbi:hypothetical protein HHI36_010823 [Cryptolaemus montrouzieri]|uniref:Uncharacterized protein n=1 Tax=Cryptolaemus montrouzieri TaxID=559131 RepID=A0ABD2MK08_9CUCU
MEVFRFHKADYITINRRISDVPWSEILSNGDLKADLNTFHVKLNNIIEDHVPKKSLDEIQKKLKIYQNYDDFLSFKHLRRESNAGIVADYNNFISNIEKDAL